MGYYEQVFSKVDFRIWIFLIPLLGMLMILPALNIPLGIDFTGGTEIQILTQKSLTTSQIESAVGPCMDGIDANVQDLEGQTSIIIRTKDSEVTKECIDSGLSTLGFTDEELQRVLPSTFKPELGKVLLEQGSNVVVIAGILMIIIVFLAFRSIIPSMAVIQAAVFDILIALGILSLLGFELNLPGVAALLMLIGYSIDTDIMLTSKLLKEGGKAIEERINNAFNTGITMTGTTLASMSAIFIATLFIRMDTITQIAAVIIVGLSVDLMTTWFTNLAILQWYSGRAKTKSSRFKFSLFRS